MKQLLISAITKLLEYLSHASSITGILASAAGTAFVSYAHLQTDLPAWAMLIVNALHIPATSWEELFVLGGTYIFGAINVWWIDRQKDNTAAVQAAIGVPVTAPTQTVITTPAAK